MPRLLIIFCLGQTVRMSIYSVLSFLAFQVNHSGMDVALVLGAETLTAPFASFWAGKMVDKYGSNTMLALANFTSCLALVFLPLIGHSVVLLIAFGLIFACLTAPLSPAARALIPQLVKDTAKANGQLGAMAGIGYAFGSVIAGVSLVLGNIVLTTILLIIVSSVAACLCVYRFAILNSTHEAKQKTNSVIIIKKSTMRIKPSNKETTQRDFMTTWHIIKLQPRLFSVVIATTILCVGYGLNIPGEVVLADILDGGASGYAALIASWSFGIIMGSLFLVARKKLVKAIFVGCITYAFVSIICGLSWSIEIACVALFLGGAADGRAATASTTLIQQLVPSNYLGSVFGFIDGVSIASVSLAIVFAGILIDVSSVRVVYCLAGVIGLAAAAVLASAVRQESLF